MDTKTPNPDPPSLNDPAGVSLHPSAQPVQGCPSGKSCLAPGRPCSWSSPHLITHRCERMKVWPSQPNSGHLLRSIPVAEFPVGLARAGARPALHLDLSLPPLLLLPPLPQGPSQAHCVKNSLQARLHRRGCFPGHVTRNTNFAVKVDAGPHLPRHAGVQAGKVRTPGIFCPMLLGPLFCLDRRLFITMVPRVQGPPCCGHALPVDISDHIFLGPSESTLIEMARIGKFRVRRQISGVQGCGRDGGRRVRAKAFGIYLFLRQ